MKSEPMPGHTKIPLRLAPLGAVTLLLLMASLPAAAAEPTDCVLNVEPMVGQAGTQFNLSGEGYSPTQLTLQKNDGRETTVELELGGADPFEIPIGSSPGDEGRWRATASIPGTDCSATATFRVTLLDTAAPPAGRRAGGPNLPLALFALVGLLGFGGGTLIARRLRLA